MGGEEQHHNRRDRAGGLRDNAAERFAGIAMERVRLSVARAKRVEVVLVLLDILAEPAGGGRNSRVLADNRARKDPRPRPPNPRPSDAGSSLGARRGFRRRLFVPAPSREWGTGARARRAGRNAAKGHLEVRLEPRHLRLNLGQRRLAHLAGASVRVHAMVGALVTERRRRAGLPNRRRVGHTPPGREDDLRRTITV